MNRLILWLLAVVFWILALGGIPLGNAAYAQVEQVIEEVLIDQLSDEELWDTAYHTSDEEGEKSTQYHHRESPPDGAIRTGCECMDGEVLEQKGQGACSGHGGVRYWRYQLVDGDLYLMPTDRHRDHPEPLSKTEIQNLSAHNTGAPKSYFYRRGSSMSWMDMVSLLIICLTVAYVARLIWQDGNNKRGNNSDGDRRPYL